ncbi:MULTISPECIES: hypothetical protein [Acidithiobacillus]|uniref:Uncharacterized protein n=1 Tax=Acidithiobacillus ferridurans TaxID=1232575 RepID=A0A8X8GFR1_ACIFI|nr:MULTISPECIES: hypothetical protein [Acidithiobacillus]MBU2716055.1 hypothetical protein [Acidithiobacillus ferridurans]MBU2723618.1 hypothetical protein [Acidithiobacillus ferridurans]MBU2727030.1 hypothetical protein [Acidithiobacillus ferridurans]MBU2803754.1 hypothetical protein [Acidithiobacillus ferridurans]
MDNPSQAPAAAWRRPVWSTARESCVGTALGSSPFVQVPCAILLLAASPVLQPPN